MELRLPPNTSQEVSNREWYGLEMRTIKHQAAFKTVRRITTRDSKGRIVETAPVGIRKVRYSNQSSGSKLACKRNQNLLSAFRQSDLALDVASQVVPAVDVVAERGFVRRTPRHRFGMR